MVGGLLLGEDCAGSGSPRLLGEEYGDLLRGEEDREVDLERDRDRYWGRPVLSVAKDETGGKKEDGD